MILVTKYLGVSMRNYVRGIYIKGIHRAVGLARCLVSNYIRLDDDNLFFVRTPNWPYDDCAPTLSQFIIDTHSDKLASLQESTMEYDDVDNEFMGMKPKDFYFRTAGYDMLNRAFFYITPKKYHDTYGYLLDTAITDVSDVIFPPGFNESCDSGFNFKGTAAEGRQLLLDAGFIENKTMSL